MFASTTPTGFSGKPRKASNATGANQHHYSRSQIPSLSNIQQVRKTVYSTVAPSASTAYTSVVLNRNKKSNFANTQHLNGSLNLSSGNQVNLNISAAAKTPGNGHLLHQQSATGVRYGNNEDSSNTNTSSMLTATSPLSHRHNRSNTNGGGGLVQNLGHADESTAVQTVVSSNFASHGLAQKAMRVGGEGSVGNSHEMCVSVDMLMNTVKALVEHFDSKICELTVMNQQGKATQSQQHKTNKMIDTQRQIASNSTEIIDKIEHLIFQQASLNSQTQKDVVEPKAYNKEQITVEQVDFEKENRSPTGRHSTAKKEEISQLTIAHVPPTELESAPSAKAGNASSRSLPKSSRSQKRKKNDNAHGKVIQPQPFRPSVGMRTAMNATAPQPVTKKRSLTRKGQTGSSGATRPAGPTGLNTTQSLFKPNPNFALLKNKRAGRKESPQPQAHNQMIGSSQPMMHSPGDRSARVVDIQRVDSKPTSCLMVTQNCSLNHFQDVLNSSQSLLKSISRDDDSAHQQMQQFIGHHADVKTPGLGTNEEEFLFSGDAKVIKSSPRNADLITTINLQQPFAANLSDNSSVATSTFKVEKPLFVEASFSNECNQKTAAGEKSNSSNKDMTPDKANDNLLQLLSSLEGLTPAGLEYLVKTQDKLAATMGAPSRDSDAGAVINEQQNGILSQKNKNENGFFSNSNRMQYPQTLTRTNSQMMRSMEAGNVRQHLNFVDVSDGATSPTPSVTYGSHTATIDAPRVAPRLSEPEHVGKDQIQKRLSYEATSSIEPVIRKQQNVTPRVSTPGNQGSSQRTTNAGRRQKSTKNHQSRSTMGGKNDLLAFNPKSVLDSRRTSFAAKQTSTAQHNSRNSGNGLAQRGSSTSGTNNKAVTPRVSGAGRQQSSAQTLNSSLNGKTHHHQGLTKKASVDALRQSSSNLIIGKNSLVNPERANNASQTSCMASARLALRKADRHGHANQAVTARDPIVNHSGVSLGGFSHNPLSQSTRSLTTLAESTGGRKKSKNQASTQQLIANSSQSSQRFEDRFKQLSKLVEKHQVASLESTLTQNLLQPPSVATVTAVTTPAGDQSQPIWQNSNGQIEKPQSTETTLGRRENDYKIESERDLSSDENDNDFFYDEVDEEIKAELLGAEDAVDNNEMNQLIPSEKFLLQKRGIFGSDGGKSKSYIGASNSKIEKVDIDSLGSLEKQIQQIEISRDLFQRMDLDYKDIKITEAGHVFEPSESNPYCEMLRPNVADDEQRHRSSMGNLPGHLCSAQEMEPSGLMRMNPLNLSMDENEQLPVAVGAGQHQTSDEEDADIARPEEIGTQFEQNTSNVSFG